MDFGAEDSSKPARSVAQALVRQLQIQGVRRAALVPGESYLPVLDALKDSLIDLTVCRHEGGASMMADAWGRATGEPGICFVTRGPGAANAFVGLHIAAQDSNPLILFVGMVDRSVRGRDAWQEIDLQRAFGGVAKWVVDLDDSGRVAEIISRAFHLAVSGRPGPVVIGLPCDVLSLADRGVDAPPAAVIESGPDKASLAAIREQLAASERPIVIVGGSRWDETSRAAMHRFAEVFELPVVTSYRRGGLFDAGHPNYAGDLGLGPNPKLIARLKNSDLILLLGGRMGDVTSQRFSLLNFPDPKVKLVHLHSDADELGSLYRPSLAVAASPRRFAPALAALEPLDTRARSGQAAAAHRDYLEWSQVATPQPGDVNFGEIVVWLRDHLEEDAILCNGAGGYAAWLHRFYRFADLNAHIAPASATMGYGPPAAIAMKQLYPHRRVVCLAGDGDFLMNGQEFATMMQYDLPITTIIIDNGSYGSIRLSQERAFPGRVVGTDLKNPDFAAYARAFGGFGASVNRTEDFGEAFRAAEASGLPAIVHVKVSVECMTPAMDLSAIRSQALAET